MSACFRTGEQRGFPCDCLRSDSPLNTIVIDLYAAIFQEALKLCLSRQTIADRFGKLRFTRDARLLP
jgi:hypothetical protein